MQTIKSKHANLLCASAVMDGMYLQRLDPEEVRKYSHSKLVHSMANELVDRFPIKVQLEEECGVSGYADERHLLMLYAFTPAELQEFVADIRRDILLDLATTRCLNVMPEPKRAV